jgi:hypothetical protein
VVITVVVVVVGFFPILEFEIELTKLNSKEFFLPSKYAWFTYVNIVVTYHGIIGLYFFAENKAGSKVKKKKANSKVGLALNMFSLY